MAAMHLNVQSPCRTSACEESTERPCTKRTGGPGFDLATNATERGAPSLRALQGREFRTPTASAFELPAHAT